VHVVPGLKVLYFGTPVVLVSSRNEDGTTNIAPMSSAWWLEQGCMLGLGINGQTSTNLINHPECVLNLASSSMVDAVDRLALTTGRKDVPEYKLAMGYQYTPDKFAHAGLTEQASDLVAPSRVLECPIQLECRIVATHRMTADPTANAFEAEVLRAHVAEELVVPGTHYVDPDAWDPLIMKFCEFYGNGQNVHASRLADGWEMPHPRQPATA
jgi:flavin reductase (DIM6/NTAB) family NADH-FMN oxidoreductase RutF